MSAATVYRYRLPLPPRGVGGNARGHWAARARVTREYREECAAAYREQGRPSAPLERVHVTVEMRVCRKRVRSGIQGETPVGEYLALVNAADRYRPRDAGNVLDACKAAIDALQPASAARFDKRGRLRSHDGANVVVGDDAKHMTLAAPRLV